MDGVLPSSKPSSLRDKLDRYAYSAGKMSSCQDITQALLLNSMDMNSSSAKLAELRYIVQAKVNASACSKTLKGDLSKLKTEDEEKTIEYKRFDVSKVIQERDYSHVWVGLHLNTLRSKTPWFRHIYAFGSGTSSVARDLVSVLPSNQKNKPDFVVQDLIAKYVFVQDARLMYLEFDEFLALASSEEISMVCKQIMSAVKLAHNHQVAGLTLSVSIMKIPQRVTLEVDGERFVNVEYIPVFRDFSTAYLSSSSRLHDETVRIKADLKDLMRVYRKDIIKAPAEGCVEDLRGCVMPLNDRRMVVEKSACSGFVSRQDYARVIRLPPAGTLPLAFINTLKKQLVAIVVNRADVLRRVFTTIPKTSDEANLRSFQIDILAHVIKRHSFELTHLNDQRSIPCSESDKRLHSDLSSVHKGSNYKKLVSKLESYLNDNLSYVNDPIDDPVTTLEYNRLCARLFKFVHDLFLVMSARESITSDQYKDLDEMLCDKEKELNKQIYTAIDSLEMARRGNCNFTGQSLIAAERNAYNYYNHYIFGDNSHALTKNDPSLRTERELRKRLVYDLSSIFAPIQ